MAGAVVLWIVLEWYGATSEVSWLFLLASWVFALLAVCALYAVWNRGLTLQLSMRNSRPAAGSPAEDLPEHVLRRGPYPAPIFEGDALELAVGLDTKGGARGPAWIAGEVAGSKLSSGTGVVPRQGWRHLEVLPDLLRGPVGATGWRISTSDPIGFFYRRKRWPDGEVAVVLPRFASLAGLRQSRQLEASVAAPRAGSGNQVFGIREYRAGDSLRRIHWRSSARHGELVVREYEPPGLQTLGIFIDSSPPSREVADQVARIAASETWDCIRDGGRVVLWAPGMKASEPPQGRDIWALLEWLARYPGAAADDPAPAVSEAVMVSGSADQRLIDAVETARRRGARVRAWVVGETEVVVDAPVERTGIEWPL
ncbi:MAG: DUF58 domain-containing protein [Chloroflexi bacterium]|nr:MAG: DUF58 domain-containing protein [Chloroflexota bacterium]